VADQARGEALQQAHAIAARQLDVALECLAYELTQCEEDAESWILRIQWRSTEAHLNGFRKGPYFPAFLEAIRGFTPEIAEMHHGRYASAISFGSRHSASDLAKSSCSTVQRPSARQPDRT
jgi:quinol monooxygenase YgiN